MSPFIEVLQDFPLPQKDTNQLTLQMVNDASLTEARALSANGQWEEAIHHYHTLGDSISVAQMFINLGHFQEAETVLQDIEDNDPDILQRALAAEKHGWIDDYHGRFDDEITHFQTAQNLLMQTPAEDRQDDFEDKLETVRHFQGRAHVALAAQGIDADSHISAAIELFEQNVEYLGTKPDTTAKNIALSFQHTWLARCELLRKNFSAADSHIRDSVSGFEEFKKEHEESGILGSLYQIQGMSAYYQSDYKTAYTFFRQALAEHLATDNYKRGIASALIGISMTYFAQGKKELAHTFAQDAVKADPTIVYFPGI